MFLHLSLSHSVHRGGGLPKGVSAHRGCLSRGRGVCPGGLPLPPADTPLAQCMLGYGQQAGGTHPTGMQSC